MGNYRNGFSWEYLEPASEKWLVSMMATNPVIFGWAEQLLGKGEVVTPDKRDGPSGTRGIYCRLPAGHLPEEPTICHCDVGKNGSLLTPRPTKPSLRPAWEWSV